MLVKRGETIEKELEVCDTLQVLLMLYEDYIPQADKPCVL